MLWWNKIFQKYGHKEHKKILILSNKCKNRLQKQCYYATSSCLLDFKISFEQDYKEIVNHLHFSKVPTAQEHHCSKTQPAVTSLTKDPFIPLPICMKYTGKTKQKKNNKYRKVKKLPK